MFLVWTTGRCTETMTRRRWNVRAFIGRTGFVRLVDYGSGGWGHINFDDLKGNIRCESEFPVYIVYFSSWLLTGRFLWLISVCWKPANWGLQHSSPDSLRDRIVLYEDRTKHRHESLRLWLSFKLNLNCYLLCLIRYWKPGFWQPVSLKVGSLSWKRQ